MKKIYQTPSMETIMFMSDDIITGSPISSDPSRNDQNWEGLGL